MRSIIAKIVSVFNGGGSRRGSRGHGQSLLSQSFSAIRSFFSGGPRRR